MSDVAKHIEWHNNLEEDGLTYIESAWAAGWRLQVEDCKLDPETDVTVRVVDSGGGVKAQATVNRYELVSALLQREDTVSLAYHNEVVGEAQRQIRALEDRVENMPRELGCGCDEADGNLNRALAERDALAETIGRIKTVIEPCGVVDTAEIWIALDPKPFVLPTEVPARIEAVNKDGGTVEMHLWTDGHNLTWHNMETGADLFPDTVMAHYSGHRLLDEV